MAGRGRGPVLSFNLEGLNIDKRELMDQDVLLNIPLYPPLLHPPVPDNNYDPAELKLLEMKREMRAKIQKRSAHLTLEEKKRDVERYSDKYQRNQQDQHSWKPDWSQFPPELRPKKRKKVTKPTVTPNQKGAKVPRVTSGVQNDTDLKELLESLTDDKDEEDEEKKPEEEVVEEEDEFVGDQEDEDDEDEEESEDRDEEETDYNVTYFDNGEGYGDDNEEEDEPSFYF